MKPSQKLELRQGQSLVMTQQLQQSIKLLQLSSLELIEFVEQELESNPLLARDETGVGNEAAEAGEAASAGTSDERESATDRSESLDSNYGDGWQHDEGGERPDPAASFRYEGVSSRNSYDGDERSLEQTLSTEITLREHLHSQLQVDMLDPVMRMLGSQIIEMIDDSGYLRETTQELAETLGASPELLRHTITALQQFDPVGIFARNLPECLTLQLKDKNLFDPMMASFMEHIHLMEKGDLQGLRKACGASEEDFADMLTQIRKLDPYPARRFINDMAQPVIPDVFVRQGKEGIWQVELNSEVLPKVLIDQAYYQELDTRSHQKEDKRYLTDQFQQANWLVKAMDQRANTILKVTSEIVRQQEHFLLYGIQFLKPLTLKDIALQVEMHESTISRVTTSKFMATPRGIFELKYFFTSSVSSSSGATEISSKTVMYYIKELIEAEAPEQVLSDDDIVKMLKNKNIDIARRTVAKYREGQNIPSSVIRRRQKTGA